MKIMQEISMDEFVLDIIRVLVLIKTFEDEKTIINDEKIRLFDYYLKFPHTMLEESKDDNIKINFDEYYSFYHWKPNIIHYRKVMDYLLAKNFVIRTEKSGYIITERGTGCIAQVESQYFFELLDYAKVLKEKHKRSSNKNIEIEILEKSNILREWLGDNKDE